MEYIQSIFNITFFSMGDYSFKLYNLLLFILTIIVFKVLIKLFKAFVHKTIKKRELIDEEKARYIVGIGKVTLTVFGVILAIRSLSLRPVLAKFLDYEILSGENPITVSKVLFGLFALLVCVMLVKLSVVLIKASIDSSGKIDKGREFTIIKLFKYFAYFLSIIIALYVSGVNLKGMFLGSAALLVGVGIGIQHLFGDFIAGIVILFEDSFDVGDIVFMDGEIMQVKQISMRTSTVMKRDGNLLTIPNRLLTDNKIINWSQGSPYSRMEVEVSVAYGSDMDLVKSILHKVAISHPGVDPKKPVRVFMEKFNDSGIDFSLLFWIKNSWEFRSQLSDIRFAIDKQFRENNVEIPFPQRDINFRTSLPLNQK